MKKNSLLTRAIEKRHQKSSKPSVHPAKSRNSFFSDVQSEITSKHACGNTLKALRQNLGMSQYEASVVSGMNSSYLSGVEKGKHSLSVNMLLSYGKGLGYCTNDIVMTLGKEVEKLEDES